MKSRLGSFVRRVLVLVVTLAWVPGQPGAQTARAQSPGAGGATSAEPAGTAALAPPMLMGYLGEAHVAIVAGNVASARERALTEAFRRAVDAALTALVPEARLGQPKVVIQVLGRARGFIRRYRTLEEGELVRGSYAVKIDAEVDDGALRRAFDRAPSPAAVAAAGTGSSMSYLVVGAGPPEAVDAVAKKLAATGARILRGSAADAADAPAHLLETAVRAQMGAVAFVSATVSDEGRVRGLGLESVTCSISLRVRMTASGASQSEESQESEAGRGFALDERLARADCLERAVASVVARTVPAAGARDAADLRNVIIDADVVEPAAVLAMLKQLRGLASVSTVDVRRIVAGRAELRVRSRLPGAALAALLVRDSAVLDWLSPEATGDLVKARVRMSASRTSPASGEPPPSPGAAAP